MALFSEGNPCSICGKPVTSDQEIIGFTFMGVGRPFDGVDDSVVHDLCLANWENRDAFVAKWNEVYMKLGFNRPIGLKLRVNEEGRVRYVEDEKLTAEEEKQKKLFDEQLEKDKNKKAIEFYTRVVLHNKKCDRLNEQLQKEGLECTHCGVKSQEIRYMNNAPDRASYFICRLCSWSFFEMKKR